MGQLKKALMSVTYDDMGLSDLSVGIGELETAYKQWDLSKYTVEELEAELQRRGWKVTSK